MDNIYTNEELIKIQKIEEEALKEILRVCDLLNVKCFLIAGSVLGAVRHGGFIPWDDDMDIGMSRDDYNKFLNYSGKYLNEKYQMQSPYDYENACPYSYAKLRINGTKFVEYCNRNVDMHQGIYIDIFPFDEVPDDEKANIKQFNKVQRLKKIYVYRETPDVSEAPKTFKDTLKRAARYIIHYICKLIPRKVLMREIDKWSTKYNGKGTHAISSLDFPKRMRMYALKEEMYPLKECKFDGISAYMPGNYEAYLTHHYGDWRKLPPKELRFGHKPWQIELEDR